MPCAMVLYFDRPFEEVEPDLALFAAAEVRMRSAAPREDIQVLVIRGFERIPDAARGRLAELRYRVIDAAPALEAVRRRFAFANEARVWRGEAFHEMCFLRWLVLETVFPGAPVLAMDADVVWRAEPYEMLQAWSAGGSTLCHSSPCFAFIKDAAWYEAYRSGLRRLAEDPGFGADFAKDHFTGLYHDQALLQFLIGAGEIENDVSSLVGHGLSARWFMGANPLNIAPAKGEAPFAFAQSATEDRIGGKPVAYWHMQQRFARYLWGVRFLAVMAGGRAVRAPYKHKSPAEPNPLVLLLKTQHDLLRKGLISLNSPKHQALNGLLTRAGVYREFFDGSLAGEAFREAVWWKRGVWAQ